MRDIILYVKRNYQKPENGLMQVIITFFLSFTGFLLFKVVTLIMNKGDISFYTRTLYYMRLYPKLSTFLQRPWTILTYVFAQDVGFLAFFSLLFQMNLIYILGSQFIDFFNSRRFVRFYIASIIFSASTVLLFSKILPYIQEGTSLAGVSVSIYALVAAIATMMPRFPILIVKTQYIALFCVLLSLWDISELGYISRGVAKLAAMLWGYIYVIYARSDLKKLFGHWFSMHRKKEKKTKERKNDAGINYLLDKIAKKGYNNLTSDEKRDLFEASK
ncbi:MAG: rhomboid family intramembrane serine protease [Bacteroidota bacterium]